MFGRLRLPAAAAIAMISTVAAILLLGPPGLHLLSGLSCIAITLVILTSFLLKNPLFHAPPSAIEANDVQPGALLTLCAALTALILQTHHPLIGYAVERHSHFSENPLPRLMRTIMFIELAFNGSSEDKEKLTTWLRHIHRHVRGTIPTSVLSEAGLEDMEHEYGYTNELMAYVVQSLTWSLIAFHRRFGRRDQAKEATLDAIVLRFTCMGRQLGIPESLLARDYNGFLVSFQSRLHAIAPRTAEYKHSLRPRMIAKVGDANAALGTTWFTQCLLRSAWFIGVSLLPDDVRLAYDLPSMPTGLTSIFVKACISLLDVLYLQLPWLPLRGMVALVCSFEPEMQMICQDTLQIVRSIGEAGDKSTQQRGSRSDRDDFIQWLSVDSHSINRSHPHATLLQCLAVRSVQVQRQAWLPTLGSIPQVAVWVTLAGVDAARLTLVQCLRRLHILRCNFLRKDLFSLQEGKAVSLPDHVGFVMDGNRRYARCQGLKSVILGHALGAAVATSLLTWWVDLTLLCAQQSATVGLRVLTLWALSSDNLKRPKDELDGLLLLLAREFRMLAVSALVHQLKIRVRVIGSAAAIKQFPESLQAAITLLEHETSRYESTSGLVLQIAVGYGGQDEIVDGVQRLAARGDEVTTASLSRQTYSALNGAPPVNLIVRTSERRTSGFLLWETQGAEICFLDKLWPELDETDWLSAVRMYGRTEQRFGR